MTRVLSLGEVMVELAPDTADPARASLGIAGDTFNTAVYLKRQGPGLEVAYATKLGRDRFSDRILERLREEDISTAMVARSDDRLPGLYAIITDEKGERSFLYWRDASAYRTLLQPPGLDLEALGTYDLVYLSAISLAVLPQADRDRLFDRLAAYRKAGGRVAFDSNYRPRLWPDAATARAEIERAWRLTDLGLPSVDDEMALYGDAGWQQVRDRLRGWGVTQGALKRGHEGPVSLGEAAAPPAPPVARVVDSTAAGDSFNAGYLAARLGGANETDALAAGHALASRVIQHRGAILPRDQEETT